MGSATSYRHHGRGPFRVDQLRPGDPYELSDGHAIVAEPSGRRHGRRNLSTGALIDTDPAVEAAGVDVGYALGERTLRAPDVSAGNLADEAGFAAGAPALAVEYVERGRDQADLERKVAELLAAGTQVVWVVRLGGKRRVEVHGGGRRVAVKLAGEELEAPGILRNPVPVDALYDRDRAHEATLRNLLQRHGYASLGAVREEGLAKGFSKGLSKGATQGALAHARAVLRRTLAMRGIAIGAEHEAAIDACADLEALDRWHDRALGAGSAAEVFGAG